MIFNPALKYLLLKYFLFWPSLVITIQYITWFINLIANKFLTYGNPVQN